MVQESDGTQDRLGGNGAIWPDLGLSGQEK